MTSAEIQGSPAPEPTANNTLTIPVDAEHSGLRLVIFSLFIAGAIIIYFIIDSVMPAESLSLLSIMGSILITAFLVNFVEKWLKSKWAKL